jgi:GH15 family glucan-1,4-alpha-glucosidase
MVQALARTGRQSEAEAMLDALLALGGPLGLYAEEIDPVDGEHLGNFPQALTHAALVQAALTVHNTKSTSATS